MWSPFSVAVGFFFARQVDHVESMMMHDPKGFFDFLWDDLKTEKTACFLSTNCTYLKGKKLQESIRCDTKRNIVHAVQTTSMPRLNLFSALKQLGTRALYCHTDSVMYIDGGNISLDKGTCLGQWSDVLEDSSHYILEFQSAWFD